MPILTFSERAVYSMLCAHWTRFVPEGVQVFLKVVSFISEQRRRLKVVRTDLILQVPGQEMFGHVSRQHVLQQQPVQILHGLNLLTLFFELVLPQEI